MSNSGYDTSQDYGGKASNPDRVSFSMVADRNELKKIINELYLTSADVQRVGNIYYVQGLKPGAPINNQHRRLTNGRKHR